MKVKYRCTICGTEYKANVNTHIKTCSKCRSSREFRKSSSHNWKIRQNKIVENLNSQFTILRMVITNGNYRLNIGKYQKNLGNSVTNITNYDLHLNIIKEFIKELAKDVAVLKKLKKEKDEK